MELAGWSQFDLVGWGQEHLVESAMSSGKAAGAWRALNERQRLYLSAIYDADQDAEQEIKARSARWEKTPPADEWRMLLYDLKLPKDILGYSTIQADLRRKGTHDPGAGSTLAVLERRGLVLVVHDEVFVPLVGMVPRIRVRLTTAGRAAARAGQGTTAPTRPPHGLMTERLWGTLARLYPAGEEGLPRDAPRGTPLAERAPSWNALLGLRDRRDGPYMEEFRARTGELVTPAGTQHQTYQTEWRARITAAGRHHYETHYACYRELYPPPKPPSQ